MNDAASFLAGPNGLFGPNVALGVFILFCRIGGCLMLAPGFSSFQIPVQVRLFVAVAATLTLAPLLLARLPLQSLGNDPILILRYVGTELLVGGSIGLLARLFILALETMAVASATTLGMANPFGVEVEPDEALPPLASLITLAATVLIFVTDLHWEVLRGLVASYSAIPASGAFDPGFSLRHISDVLVDSFRIALRICSPFIIYAIIVNLAISIINRLTPQIAIFYISAPFVIAGGLALLYITIESLLGEFMTGLAAWLISG
ncbi:MAG TPA: flagellar biosynthetic protein FliR [Roseiarcus sp.]|nr:flagellar biosynthetic protein FliR [Roseiarcus sp.]